MAPTPGDKGGGASPNILLLEIPSILTLIPFYMAKVDRNDGITPDHLIRNILNVSDALVSMNVGGEKLHCFKKVTPFLINSSPFETQYTRPISLMAQNSVEPTPVP